MKDNIEPNRKPIAKSFFHVKILFIATLFILGLSGSALLIPRRSASYGPILQEIGTNSLTIVWWRTGAESSVLTLSDSKKVLAKIPAQRAGNRFEARLYDLMPSSKYSYRIDFEPRKHNSRRMSGSFQTACKEDEKFSFVVFGDSGSGKSSQYQLAKTMNKRPICLAIHTGDLVYDKGKASQYISKFFRPYKTLLATTPFYPILGNHDIKTDDGRPFLETFSLPTNGPAGIEHGHCYYFDYGNARFVGLDSNLPEKILAENVAPWLQEVLLASPRQWRFVFFHHPPYAGGQRATDSKIQQILIPAIESGKADVVFCGHNHLYERTKPINGVTYIITGAGGKLIQKEKYGSEPYIAFFDDAEFSFTFVKVDQERLEIKQINENNKVIDSVILNKTAKPEILSKI